MNCPRAWPLVGVIFGGAFASLAACVGDAPVVSFDASTPNNDSSVNDVNNGTDSNNLPDAADAAPWTPSAFGNDLVLWLEGDVGLTVDGSGNVTGWLDQSPNPVAFTGSTLSPPVTDTKGSHTVVNFDRTHSNVTTPSVAKLELGATDDLLFACVMQTTAGTNGVPGAYAWLKATTKVVGQFDQLSDGFMFGVDVSSPTSNAGEMRLLVGDGGGGPYTLTSTKTPFADQNYHVLVGRRIGGTTLRVRSETLDQSMLLPQPIDISQTTRPLLVGNFYYATSFSNTFAFRLAELLVVRRASTFSASEVSRVESYLAGKYGL